ncbi:immunity 53 family protein [Moritella sp.]|uniref:immunity 53 family protein n=1 Tax=Moritella sp. TaxID=78556 RepID=UPI001DFEF56C|nr:immunity 53 family protein [Moritella sp.]MCJ8351504.1 immunity 53 family protein [Moritella sp.]NQZ40266.1 rhodanese-related sulfurtransferase [Moritella sp.]
MSNFTNLQEWYLSQCDDSWEHSFGIKIDTLDNPGWNIEIDLEGTSLENIPFNQTEIGYNSDSNWVICKVEDNKFKGASGPMMLEQMITIFLDWANGT